MQCGRNVCHSGVCSSLAPGNPRQQRDSPNSPAVPQLLTLCLPSNTGLSSTDYSARRVRAFFSSASHGRDTGHGFARMVHRKFGNYIECAFRALRSLNLRVRFGGLFFFCGEREADRRVVHWLPAPKKSGDARRERSPVGNVEGGQFPSLMSIQQHRLWKNPAMVGRGIRHWQTCRSG